ncbi:hypothetical protein SLE2022_297190 [Rubroshorea leprosula]
MARPNQEAIDTFSNTTGIPEANDKRNQNRIKIIKIRQECFPTLRLPNRVADIIDGLPNRFELLLCDGGANLERLIDNTRSNTPDHDNLLLQPSSELLQIFTIGVYHDSDFSARVFTRLPRLQVMLELGVAFESEVWGSSEKMDLKKSIETGESNPKGSSFC